VDKSSSDEKQAVAKIEEDKKAEPTPNGHATVAVPGATDPAQPLPIPKGSIDIPSKASDGTHSKPLGSQPAVVVGEKKKKKKKHKDNSKAKAPTQAVQTNTSNPAPQTLTGVSNITQQMVETAVKDQIDDAVARQIEEAVEKLLPGVLAKLRLFQTQQAEGANSSADSPGQLKPSP